MSTPVRIGGFAVVLVLLFGAAYGVGKVFDDEPTRHEYSLRLIDAPSEPGDAVLRFTIRDEKGVVATDFGLRHEKRLHLIAVDTGFSGYQHLHPTMAADGVWSTPIQVSAGINQLYADFQPVGGTNTVAREAVKVRGAVGSPALPVGRTQEVDDYQVTMLPDESAGFRFEISRRGVPVTDLDPYLGAYGHLVMLHASDGAYQHVHPEEGPAGPTVAFAAEVPTAGRYHLYLDFKAGGVVRTVKFHLELGSGEHHGDH